MLEKMFEDMEQAASDCSDEGKYEQSASIRQASALLQNFMGRLHPIKHAEQSKLQVVYGEDDGKPFLCSWRWAGEELEAKGLRKNITHYIRIF